MPSYPSWYPGASNTQLSTSQLMAYYYNAGFRGSELITMVAVSLGESGGNTAAFNASDPNGGSVGIAQINGVHFLDGSTSVSCALDPQCSANYAYSLFKAAGGAYPNGFAPWGAFTNGSYQSFMGTAQNAFAALYPGGTLLPSGNNPVTGNTGNNPVSGQPINYQQPTASSNPFSAITNLFSGAQGISAWLNPVRLLKMAVGFFLVVVVVYMILTDKVAPVVENVATQVQKVAT